MQKFFFIRMDGRYVKIDFREIIYVEGCKNYLRIVTEKKNYLVLITMKRLEQLLPVYLFRRIHKSFIVSLDKIIEFDKETVRLKVAELPIGQYYRNDLVKAVLIVNDAVGDPDLLNPYYVLPMDNNENRKDHFIIAG